MKLLLSGEGTTDMGSVRPTSAGLKFVPGPMALIIDKLIESHLNYSQLDLLESDPSAVRFVSKQELAGLRHKAPKLFPGVKHGKGLGHFTRNAELLGMEALRFKEDAQDCVVAVLFRDSDGTNSSPSNDWSQKIESIRDGFRRAAFDRGAAMVPRPKSEAWLICALKSQPYKNCDALEEASGNDGSPNSLKSQLADLVGDIPSAEVQADWVRHGQVDPHQISMPSFAVFRQELMQALP